MRAGRAPGHLGLVPLIILSTHPDDAVWSAHGLISANRGCTVVTLCAGIPGERVPPTQFDARAGFRSAADAMRARRAEDHAAAAIAGFNVRHLDGLACNYGAGPTADLVAAALEDAAPGETVVGPLGLRHPDHEQAAAAFVAVTLARGLNAWLYADLPYAYVWPDDVAPALERAGCGETVVTLPAGAGKAAAVNAYQSQVKGAHMDEILAPERFHLLNGNASL